MSPMSNTPGVQVGANVRAEMARRGITQTQLAEQIGRSQPQLSKRLTGAIPFDINELTAVAEALSVPIEKLTTTTAATQ